jgi:bacterioferritin
VNAREETFVGAFLTDVHTLRERARTNLEQRPVTTAYGADLDRVLAVLNDATGLAAEPVAAEFLAHAAEEQTHADVIAARITQLGGPRLRAGHPDWSGAVAVSDVAGPAGDGQRGPRCRTGSDPVLQRSRAWLADGDSTTRRMLETILANEEEHAEQMLTFLQKMS